MERNWLKYVRGSSWYTYVYLIYLLFVFIQPFAAHASWRMWALTIASVLVFLPCYFVASEVHRGRAALWAILCILALGYALFPSNGGAGAYLIYGAALFGFVVRPREALLGIAGCLIGIAIEVWLFHLPFYNWIFIMLMAAIVGVADIFAGSQQRANAKLRLAHEEIEHLAKIAERERIARDMHDVLGHTLSVIILKSELASKLIDRDAAGARTEMCEVEQIAREALAEVRQAIRGYRSGSLAEEFARARVTLETAGIHAECDTRETRPGAQKLSPAEETVLALVMREAVTNVVRHSGARNCRIFFEQDADHYRIGIEDDGRGGSHHEGNGLRGMRERVEALDGAMSYDGSRGTRLSVMIPTKSRHKLLA